MKLVFFLMAMLLLFAEGWLLALLILRNRDRWLLAALALPLAALLNVLLFFLFTVLGIPLSPALLWIGHAVVIGLACALARRHHLFSLARTTVDQTTEASRSKKFLLYRGVCGVLLAVAFLFSTVHAVLLHSFAIDSFTNWTMRSRISFEDRAIAFDRTEERGMAKPQYPFLVHSLQIMANQGGGWNDRAANLSTFLLSWSSLLAIYLLVRRLRGTTAALTGLTLIVGIPLFAVHLAQGYGDIHLTTFLLLSLLGLALYAETDERRWLIVSAAFLTASLWTKSEGIFFGFLPWAALVLMMSNRKKMWKESFTIMTIVLALFLPFIVFLVTQDLGFTPHDSDNSLEWHPEGIPVFFAALFRFGSLGTTWYLAPVAMLLLAIFHAHPAVRRSAFLFLFWGIAVAFMNAVIYLSTPNVAFLINGQSFARQMIPASALLLLGLVLALRWNNGGTTSSPLSAGEGRG